MVGAAAERLRSTRPSTATAFTLRLRLHYKAVRVGGVSGHGEIVLDELIIQYVPEFEGHWAQEDLFREDDGSYTEHGVMGSFLEYYQDHYEEISILELSTLCIEFEKIVSSDPNDVDLEANAICTMFLEVLVDTPSGNKIERYLGKSCKEFWNH